MKKVLLASLIGMGLLSSIPAAHADFKSTKDQLSGMCENVKAGHVGAFYSNVTNYGWPGSHSFMPEVIRELRAGASSGDVKLAQSVCSSLSSATSEQDVLNAISSGGNSGGNNGGNSGGSNTGVSKEDFDKDQKRQDDALGQEVKDRQDGDKTLKDQIDSNGGRIDKEIKDREDGDKHLQNQINDKVSQGDFKTDQERQDKNITKAQNRADEAYDYAGRNEQAIHAETKARIDGDRQTLNAANAYTNQRFSELKSQVDRNSRQIDENKRRADAGIAGVAAMANIPQVTESARFSVGAGLGARGDQSAIAVGFSSRITDNVIGKASVASDSQSQWTVGAGVAVQW